MSRASVIGRSLFGSGRILPAIALSAALLLGAFGLWVLGFDAFWATAMVLAVGTVGPVIATLSGDEQDAWEPPTRDTPRSTRLAVALIEQSLAASDRLDRPSPVRLIRSLLISERDDRLARLTVVRQMRALLVSESRARGIDPAKSDDDDVVALLGPDALTILQSHNGDEVTSAVIRRCLDAIDRLPSTTPE